MPDDPGQRVGRRRQEEQGRSIGKLVVETRSEVSTGIERSIGKLRQRDLSAAGGLGNKLPPRQIDWAATSSLLRRWEVQQSVDFDLRNRFSGEVEFVEEFIVFEEEFRNREVAFEVGYNTREFESASVGYQFGKAFDSDFQLWTAAAAYKFTDQLAGEYELEYLTLDPDPEDESTWIHVIRADEFFTPDLFLRLFFQTNSAIDRNNIRATFVYRYQPPFGTIQLAFQRGTAEFGQAATQGNTIFLKATYVF